LSRIDVKLIPTEQSMTEAYNSMPSGVTNEQGSFVVSGAPGEYFVVVWRLGDRAPTHDADSPDGRIGCFTRLIRGALRSC